MNILPTPCAMVKTWLSSRLRLPRSKVGSLANSPMNSHKFLFSYSSSTLPHRLVFALVTIVLVSSSLISRSSPWEMMMFFWLVELTLDIGLWFHALRLISGSCPNGGYYVWTHVTPFLQCPDLPVTSAFALGLSYSVFQPTNALLCIICRFWLVSFTSMMLIACHPSLSLSMKSWLYNKGQTNQWTEHLEFSNT